MAIRLIISLLMNSIICALLFNSIQINNLKRCHNKERGTFVCQAIIIPSLSTFTFHQYILIFVWSHCVIGIHYFLFPLIIRGIYLPEYWPSCSKILTPLARMHSLESSSRVSCFAVSITSFKTNIKHQLFMKKMP